MGYSSRDLNPRDAALRKYARRKDALILLKAEGYDVAISKFPEEKAFIDNVKDLDIEPDEILSQEKIDSILRSF